MQALFLLHKRMQENENHIAAFAVIGTQVLDILIFKYVNIIIYVCKINDSANLRLHAILSGDGVHRSSPLSFPRVKPSQI
jgi:hypothetical protein